MTSTRNILNINLGIGENTTDAEEGIAASIEPGSDQVIARYSGNTSIQGSSVTLNNSGVATGLSGIVFNDNVTILPQNSLQTKLDNNLYYNNKVVPTILGATTQNNIPQFLDTSGNLIDSGLLIGNYISITPFLSNGTGLSGSPTLISVSLKILRVGDVCHLILNRHINSFSNIQYYRSQNPVSEGFRPVSKASCVYNPILGTDTYEADITGRISIDSDGYIEIHKHSNTAGNYNGANQGWDQSSMSYMIA